jgi:hypothetical protein
MFNFISLLFIQFCYIWKLCVGTELIHFYESRKWIFFSLLSSVSSCTFVASALCWHTFSLFLFTLRSSGVLETKCREKYANIRQRKLQKPGENFIRKTSKILLLFMKQFIRIASKSRNVRCESI